MFTQVDAVVDVSMAGRRGWGEVGIYLALGVEVDGCCGFTAKKSSCAGRWRGALTHVISKKEWVDLW